MNRSVSALAEHTQTSLSHYAGMMKSVHGMIDAFWQRVPYLVLALLLFIVFWLASRLFKKLAARLLSRRMANRYNLLLVLQRIGAALIVFAGFLIAMMVAVPGFTPGQLVSALGIGSVAVGFAFKDIFQNLLSGILLLLNEPFKIGDRIINGSFEGTVETIEIRATTLRTYDGRRIVIPNAQLFTSPVTVNTRNGRHRLSATLTLPADTDADRLKAQILDKLSRECAPFVYQPEIALTGISGGETLTLHWWTDDHTDNNQMQDRVLSCIRPLLAASPPAEVEAGNG
ncbi:mechanosensitive ion channel family protein [Uruburuella testudinis]|uniref:Small-conductance mechanosensitive channel n=1 Tax=Uruburuella testudinis TaxID=1282863 RepID=A0ABY4DT28_9NEIS|nr:mechanosensitive ion channel family protein [Uruburuella testudinis]UOO82201.1 mechanosensitive ion channel family protein [Uruburuella testudinis]